MTVEQEIAAIKKEIKRLEEELKMLQSDICFACKKGDTNVSKE